MAVGFLAYGLGSLLDSDSLFGSLAASIADPLLDFGHIQAEINGAAAAKKAAFARYRGAVYTALGDAESGYALVAAADREAAAAGLEAQTLARAAPPMPAANAPPLRSVARAERGSCCGRRWADPTL